MERKLDISAITFDDMIGDGLESQDVSNEVEQLDAGVDQKKSLEEEVEEEREEIEEEYEEDGVEEEDEEEYEEDINDEVEEDFSIVNQIANTLGFELDGEYEETVEGLTNFIRDLSQQSAEDQLQNLFEQYPEIQKHLDFVMSGGNSQEFMSSYRDQVDYASIELHKEDINTQRAVLGQYFQAKGHDNSFIQDMLDTLEDNGKLLSKAESAKNELAAAQEEYRKQMLNKQRETWERQQRQLEEFWDDVANTIESGNDFAGITIPDKEKNKFFNYISDPVGPNGETQRDLDYQESAIEVKLAMDYLMYNGFKLDDVINKKARTKSAQSLRERIISNEQRVKSARKATRSKQFDVDDLDMGALLG